MVYIPTELVVDILRRLPSTSRRRMRLVCRSWRDLVHQRTTEMKQCRDAVLLVVTTESAYHLHDVESSKTCIPREVWRSGMDVYKDMDVVGVCNGMLCLCDDAKPGGAITLANPATGDVLALPPLPCAGLFRRHNTRRTGRSWHQAYSFGFNHERGQYKVVHVPCFFKTKDTLQVFTLGDSAWRKVQTPAYARCKLDAGLISVNGATHWVAEGLEDRIMSFDLESEQVTCTKPVPMAARPIRHLTQVHRRLSVATTTGPSPYSGSVYGTIQVWVLESTRKEQTWIHLYSLDSCPSSMARPYFIHAKYVLMDWGNKLGMYHHKPTNHYGRQSECTAVHDKTCYPKAEVSGMRGKICQTFAYIKTKEALSVYRCW